MIPRAGWFVRSLVVAAILAVSPDLMVHAAAQELPRAVSGSADALEPAPQSAQEITPQSRWRQKENAYLAGAVIAVTYGIVNTRTEVTCLGALEQGDCPSARILTEDRTRPHLASSLALAGVIGAVGVAHHLLDRDSGDASPAVSRGVDLGAAQLRVGLVAFEGSGREVRVALLQLTAQVPGGDR